jgi:hypothetical protein
MRKYWRDTRAEFGGLFFEPYGGVLLPRASVSFFVGSRLFDQFILSHFWKGVCVNMAG